MSQAQQQFDQAMSDLARAVETGEIKPYVASLALRSIVSSGLEAMEHVWNPDDFFGKQGPPILSITPPEFVFRSIDEQIERLEAIPLFQTYCWDEARKRADDTIFYLRPQRYDGILVVPNPFKIALSYYDALFQLCLLPSFNCGTMFRPHEHDETFVPFGRESVQVERCTLAGVRQINRGYDANLLRMRLGTRLPYLLKPWQALQLLAGDEWPLDPYTLSIFWLTHGDQWDKPRPSSGPVPFLNQFGCAGMYFNRPGRLSSAAKVGMPKMKFGSGVAHFGYTGLDNIAVEYMAYPTGLLEYPTYKSYSDL